MAIQKKFIDLSGRKGLANKFQGNLNDTASAPQRIYLGEDGQFADGIFNPLKNYGYLSPANNKYASVSGSINSRIIATEYDSINDDLYMAEYGTTLWHLDGLTDTSLTSDRVLSTSGTILNDLQLYELNGTRQLYYVYTSITPPTDYTMTTNFSSSVISYQIGGRINPIGSSEPVLATSVRASSVGSGSSSTLSKGMTMPSGSNQVGIVIAVCYTATNVSSATWNGSAMTSSGSGAGTAGAITINYNIFRIIAPTSGTISVTYSGSTVNRVFHAFVFNDAHQTTPYTNSSGNLDGGALFNSMAVTISAAYQVPLTFTASESATHSFADGQVSIFNTTNPAGNDSSSYYSMAANRLRVGVAPLPFSVATDNAEWLTLTSSGHFLQTVTTNNNFMRLSDNGFAYLFAENHVHKIDGATTGGTTGTVTKDVLLFPSYFRTVDAVDTRGKMYIGVQGNPISGASDVNSYSEALVGVYVWDRSSTIVGTRDFIPLYGVRDIRKIYVEPSGDVRAICIGDDRFVQIRSISSGYGKVLETLGISAYPENLDGLQIMNNMTVWLGADGIIYAHGKLTPNDSEELYKIGTINGEVSGAFTTGAIFVGNSEATQSRQGILASFTDVSSSKVLKWYPHGQGTISSVAQTGAIGDVYTQVVPLPAMSTVKNVTINNFPTANAAATTIATVKIYFNQSTTAFKSFTVTQALASKGYVSIECNKPFVSSVQMKIEFSTSQTLGTDDFNPMFAVVEYEPPSDVVR